MNFIVILILIAIAVFYYRIRRGQFSSQESVEFIKAFVENARIVPHYEDGNYVAFMVFGDAKPSVLTKHVKQNQGTSALLSAVESRIEDRNFEDEVDGMTELVRKSGRWIPNMQAKRIIVARNRPVCSWDISVEESGKSNVQLSIID